MIVHFAGFELDQARGELRGPDGEVVRLRPNAFTMLELFAANAGRALSKQELMEAVWPNVHVAEDSVFKCIHEIRTALGDDEHQLIRLQLGRGYLLEADVIHDPPRAELQPELDPSSESSMAAAARRPRLRRRTVLLATAAAGLVVVGMAIVTTMVAPRLFAGRGPVTLAVMPITGADDDLAAIAAEVTTGLSDGLAKIDNVRVTSRQNAAQDSGAVRLDFIVSGELRKRDGSWEVRARMIRTTTGEVVWTMPASPAIDDTDATLREVRLAASIGQPLAQRINAMINSNARPSGNPSSSGSTGVVIEQAMASITQVSQERFVASRAMLEKALTEDPDNVDLAVALAAIQLRGVQMHWYTPAESAAAETHARAILERGLKRRPTYLPVLEAHCRFLNATNRFVESLVACARVLSFDPWNGVALFLSGMDQLQLGRFDEALATFKRADGFGTPQTSRWTSKLGVGMTYLLMDDSESALPWLQRSIAITPGTGRSYMLLSAALARLGHSEEARAAMEKAMSLRPGSNLVNARLPSENASPTYLAATEWIVRAYLAAGLPER